MNNCIFIGNMTKAPVLAQTSNGNAQCKFTLALNKMVNGNKRTDYIPCVCFGKLAENVNRFCKEGSKVAVRGELNIDEYEDKNGVKRLWASIFVNEVEFLDKPSSENRKEQEFISPTDKPIRMEEVPSNEDLPF